METFLSQVVPEVCMLWLFSSVQAGTENSRERQSDA